jgi:hypothetical protein
MFSPHTAVLVLTNWSFYECSTYTETNENILFFKFFREGRFV